MAGRRRSRSTTKSRNLLLAFSGLQSWDGKSDIGVWLASVAFGRSYRGWLSHDQAEEWARSACHHAHAGRQQGRDRKAAEDESRSLFRHLSRDMTSGD